jgi:hypothetical protein
MIIVSLSGIQQHVCASYQSKISSKIQQQSNQDKLSTDSTKQESRDVLSSSTVINHGVSSSTVTNYHALLSSTMTNYNESSSFVNNDDASIVVTHQDISAASTTQVVCKYRLHNTCDSCVSSKNSTGKGSFQYCQKNEHCYELHQNYTSLCQAQCSSSAISSTHAECADFRRITTVVVIVYILLLIICPFLLILSCIYICVLRCRALLLNKIHVGNDVDTPVRLIQLYNSAPVNSDDGVVHPTTAVRVGNISNDGNVIYAQAEIHADDDDDNRSGGVKIYRGYDLHTV